MSFPRKRESREMAIFLGPRLRGDDTKEIGHDTKDRYVVLAYFLSLPNLENCSAWSPPCSFLSLSVSLSTASASSLF